ncbi:golgin subfamily A member 2-like [Bemisia tabaci]|uniref:golgin subfamily A member 2-like n=1 Tax=Bemisia tabaci TaxID=7038 RepID=UPI003B289543
MGDKAEKLAAAKKTFKEFQNRKQRKDVMPELTNVKQSVNNELPRSLLPPVLSKNGVDSPLNHISGTEKEPNQETPPFSTSHFCNSSIPANDVFEAHHAGPNRIHQCFNSSRHGATVEDLRHTGPQSLLPEKPKDSRTLPSGVQSAMHPSTYLSRQFSQDSESVASSPELHSVLRFEESRACKKNLIEFQSSKSSSAESDKTNATLSSDCFLERRRTDSVSTIYSSSDNQDRKLSYGVGDSFEHGDVLELEKKIEELGLMLQAERTNNIEVKAALCQAESTIRELQRDVEVQQSKQNKVSKAAESYELQLKTYAQTVEILVSEKTELERNLESARDELALQNLKQEEFRTQTAAAAHRITELESELKRAQSMITALQNCSLESRLQKAELAAEESRNELMESRARLESKSVELRKAEEKCRETESALSLATLRVQQLSNNDGAENCDNELKVLQEMNATLTAKVATLEQSLRVLELERDNASAHYQSYVRSLNSELSSLKSRFEGVNNEKDRLVAREESLVQHVADLEKQLQLHQVKIDELNARNTPSIPDAESGLTLKEKKIASLEAEKEVLKGKLQQLAEEKNKLTENVLSLESRLERLEGDQIDMTNLQITLESDRVAASRAIQQNNDLKLRLQELQDAFIKLSNEKLELMEKLLHEESVNKDYAEKLQLEQSRNEDLLKHSAERMNHSHNLEISATNLTEVSEEPSTKLENTLKSNEAISQTDVETTSHMDVEAMAKLEEKFRHKMKELADLSDEKQRLEHLVMQLQSETETIGEYVALYQIQRGALQEKAKEKDQQVVKLAQDKENLRNKLAELTELIKNLISKQASAAVIPSSSLEPTIHGEEIDAEQIMRLLSDIGTTSLNQPAANFHPCPWCSGQLITV